MYGRFSPSTSFGCSGFCLLVFTHTQRPTNLPRTTAQGFSINAPMYRPLTHGQDIIFFTGTYSPSHGDISHMLVSMWKRNDEYIVATPSNMQLSTHDYWQQHFLCVWPSLILMTGKAMKIIPSQDLKNRQGIREAEADGRPRSGA